MRQNENYPVTHGGSSGSFQYVADVKYPGRLTEFRIFSGFLGFRVVKVKS